MEDGRLKNVRCLIFHLPSSIFHLMMTITVCVGSSCHIKGTRELIMRFNECLKAERLEDQVELKGSFCMERCGEGLNWQINDESITSSNVEEALNTFRKKIVAPFKS